MGPQTPFWSFKGVQREIEIPLVPFFFCRVRRFLFPEKKKMRHNAMVITM
jgi:hypothetical protein